MASKPATGVLPSLMGFLAQTGGREKSCRTIQYLCKFLATRYAQQYEIMIANRTSIAQKKSKTEALMTGASMTRKLLRFGPSITLMITLFNNLKALTTGDYKDPVTILICKILSGIFVGLFFICDHYVWLFQMGLAKNKDLNATMGKLSSLGWFLDCITGIIKNLILYGDAKTKQERQPVLIDLSRCFFDFFVAYSFVKPGSLNGKTAGLLGTLTSLIGIYQMWK